MAEEIPAAALAALAEVATRPSAADRVLLRPPPFPPATHSHYLKLILIPQCNAGEAWPFEARLAAIAPSNTASLPLAANNPCRPQHTGMKLQPAWNPTDSLCVPESIAWMQKACAGLLACREAGSHHRVGSRAPHRAEAQPPAHALQRQRIAGTQGNLAHSSQHIWARAEQNLAPVATGRCSGGVIRRLRRRGAPRARALPRGSLRSTAARAGARTDGERADART